MGPRSPDVKLEISVIVLAGGASRRMGTNKALLRVGDETLIARVIRNMQPISNDLVLVSNTPELYGDLPVRHAADHFVGQGPLAGLHAGLTAARHAWSLAVACDMPLVDHRLVRYMTLLTEGHQAVVPRINHRAEPLHALYHKSVLAAIQERLEAADLRMISFFPAISVRYVDPPELAIFDPEGRSFSNANTPEEWERLRMALLSEQKRRPGRSQAKAAPADET